MEMFEELIAMERARVSGVHGQDCTCSQCREYWLTFGPDPETAQFGPFGDELWSEFADRMGAGACALRARFKTRVGEQVAAILENVVFEMPSGKEDEDESEPDVDADAIPFC